MSDDDNDAALAHQQELEQQMSLFERLATIQTELVAPKGKWNDFSKFNYRSCEDILVAVKPLLNGLILTLTDEVTAVGDRIYVKATAKLSDGKDHIDGVAYAREALTKKGMDDAQITGSASSYARKYALAGLFLIDNEDDPDGKDNRTQAQTKVIKATDGALESLDPADQKKAREIADDIKAKYDFDNAWGAFECYDGISDNELRIAVWGMLDSKVRSTLKKMKTESETEKA